jgi:hypothetical protein
MKQIVNFAVQPIEGPMGRCTAGKLQRILASAGISQHAKLNMAGFVLYLLDQFALRCRMVELHPKARKIEFPGGNTEAGSAMEALSNQHSAVSENQQQHQKRFTTEGTENTEESKAITQQRAEALAVKLAQTYEELSRLLERNPGMKRQMTEGDAREDNIYQRLKQRLKMADMAPRCQWVKQDGTACRSPQMKQHIYCFAHKQMAEARALMLMLPVVEDANAIQVGLMRIQKAVIEDTISMKKAGLLLYSMQLAMTNVSQTTFGQAKDEEMVRETVDEDEAFSEHLKPLTTKDTKDTEEEQGLPRINAGERGLENPNPIFWKPTADMYRMDTPEGREAYEATLR